MAQNILFILVRFDGNNLRRFSSGQGNPFHFAAMFHLRYGRLTDWAENVSLAGDGFEQTRLPPAHVRFYVTKSRDSIRRLIIFQSPLLLGGVNLPEVVDDGIRLGCGARLQEAGHRDCRQDGDDGEGGQRADERADLNSFQPEQRLRCRARGFEMLDQPPPAFLGQLAHNDFLHGGFRRMRDGFAHQADGDLEPVVKYRKLGVLRKGPAQQRGLFFGQFVEEQRGDARLDLVS